MTEGNLETERKTRQRRKHIVEFDPKEIDSVTTKTALALAEASGRDVTELEPLGEWVDCDAIEQLFASDDGKADLSVSFGFQDWQVFVSNLGRIVVTPEPEEPENL